MKHLTTYKLFESSEFEPGVDLEYIDIFLEDIKDAGYDIQQYFGFKNYKAGELMFSQEFTQRHPHTADMRYDKLHVVNRGYLDNLISKEGMRVHGNAKIYQDYLNGDMSYIIKIYSYMKEKGYTFDDFPFGEITYSEIYPSLKQLISYMSNERGLSYYKIYATTGATRKNEMVPWDYTVQQFDNIEDMKDVKVIGGMSLHISKNKDFLPDSKI